MIVREIVGRFYKTYSDENKYIRLVGTEKLYTEVYDIVERKYEETNIKIEEPEIIEEEQYEES